MSIPSLASNLENSSSAFNDPRQLKHLGSSEIFQTFLVNSPFTVSSPKPMRPQHQRSGHYVRKATDDAVGDFDDMMEYVTPQKRSCIMFEPASAIFPRSTKRQDDGESSLCSMAFEDLCDVPPVSQSVIKETAEELGSESHGKQTSQSVVRQRKLKTSQGYSRGFECPNMENLDEVTKQFIVGLQDRVMRLEGEVVKLKKDNSELSTQNKKYEDKMIAVLEEQERLAKTRGDYEKKIASLRGNCQDNQDVVNSLRDILKMQENEFFDRVVKKEAKQQAQAKSMPNVKISRSSTKVSQNQASSSVPSLEAILEKDANGNTERKKLSIKVGTAKTLSKNSISSLTRKPSAINSRHENCFKTLEVAL